MLGKANHKYFVTLLATVLGFSLCLLCLPAFAQDETGTDQQSGDQTPPAGGIAACGEMNDCLKAIVANTYQALVRINNVPEQLQNISKMALSWLTPDDSDETGVLQGSFAKLGLAYVNQPQLQLSQSLNLSVQQFSPGKTNTLANPPDQPSILTTTPQINGLTYSTVLGSPVVTKGVDNTNAALNYVINASAINIQHPVPSWTWRGNARAKGTYYNTYNTTMAIESFDAYVLGRLLLDKDNALTTEQNKLLTQATDSKWLATIGSEDLGKVIRQILIFQSQTYVLLSQIFEIEKQMLTAQVMSNSLLIINNSANEDAVVPRAMGIPANQY